MNALNDRPIRTIAVVTGSRAEYGLLYHLIKRIHKDELFELNLIVTGMHCSPEFGHTLDEIKASFPVADVIEILLSSDSAIGVGKAMGLLQISMIESFSRLQPDCVVILGDRFEALATAASACVANIPIVHLHGGELSLGAIDDAFRHAITKLSHLHFTATEQYRQRVIQMGECPSRVFNIGAMAMDNIHNQPRLDKETLIHMLDLPRREHTILVTFHPETRHPEQVSHQVTQLLDALDSFKACSIIFTRANAGTSGRQINAQLEAYVHKNNSHTRLFASLGANKYLSLLAMVDVVVGNSSSGIIEAPSLATATVNIGQRQLGRIQAKSIINCTADASDLIQSIQTALTPAFQQHLATHSNPYEQDNPSAAILTKLKACDQGALLNKTFQDFPADTLTAANPC